MPFSKFPLHADLLRGVRELGFSASDADPGPGDPPAAAGKDLLACAMTGSGKTAAFLLPILHRVMTKPRGTTRALVLTPTRELAAQILAHLEELAVHTPVTGAAVYGGVGMGPQEHAFRSRVDVVVATPGRLLDHLRFLMRASPGSRSSCSTRPIACSTWASCPTSGGSCGSCPRSARRCSSAPTMPREIATLAKEMLKDPVTINLERKSAPAVGITQAVYPVGRELKSALLAELVKRDIIADAIVFTRTKHRANRLADFLERHGISTAKIHGQSQPEPADGRAAGVQGGQVADSRRHRHRRPGHRRRGTGPRHQLRRAAGPRCLHPSCRADGQGRDDRRCFHARVAGRGAGPARDRARHRQTAPAGDVAGVRLREEDRGTPGDPGARAPGGGAGRPEAQARRSERPFGPPPARGGPAHRTGGQRKEERFRSILDRHAPAAPGSRSGPSARPGPHRRRG